MKNAFILTAAVLAVGAMGLATPASATPVDVTGALVWAVGTPTTAYSAVNENFDFSFQVDSVLPSTSPSASTSVTNFSYSLNNVAVPTSLASVSFFDGSAQGMFNLNLSGPAGSEVISIYGQNVGNIGTNWMIGPTGTYPVTAAISDLDPTGQGTVTLSVSAVPLPGALPLFGATLAGLAGLALRKRAYGHRLTPPIAL